MSGIVSTVVFYLFSLFIIIGALATVLLRNLFHSALALTATLFLVAGLFVLLGADFLGVTQVLVYVGGIMIIMLFVVIFSQQASDSLRRKANRKWRSAAFISATLLAFLLSTLTAFRGIATHEKFEDTTAALGRLLLGDMIVPFEVVSLVLLAALVGAVLFGQGHRKPT